MSNVTNDTNDNGNTNEIEGGWDRPRSAAVVLGRLLAAFGRLEVISSNIIEIAALAATPTVHGFCSSLDEGVKHPLVAGLVAEVEDLRQRALAGEAEVLPTPPPPPPPPPPRVPGEFLWRPLGGYPKEWDSTFVLSWALGGASMVSQEACIAFGRGRHPADPDHARKSAEGVFHVFQLRFKLCYTPTELEREGLAFEKLLEREFGMAPEEAPEAPETPRERAVARRADRLARRRGRRAV